MRAPSTPRSPPTASPTTRPRSTSPHPLHSHGFSTLWFVFFSFSFNKSNQCLLSSNTTPGLSIHLSLKGRVTGCPVWMCLVYALGASSFTSPRWRAMWPSLTDSRRRRRIWTSGECSIQSCFVRGSRESAPREEHHRLSLPQDSCNPPLLLCLCVVSR
jgi:hypothetical protein